MPQGGRIPISGSSLGEGHGQRDLGRVDFCLPSQRSSSLQDAAYDFFVKGCNLGYYKACFNAGLVDADVRGDYGPRTAAAPDVKKAAFYYKKSCEQGEIADACYR